MSDDTLIVDKIGSLFLGGPPLVKAATGEVVTAEQLGGATLHCTESGCTDYFAKDEEAMFKGVRDIVSTVPAVERQKLSDSMDSQPLFSDVELQGLGGEDTASKNVVYQIMARVADRSEFSEFRELYGSGVVCGFCRIAGKLVGAVMGVGGGIDSKGASKACQLVQMCNERNVPLLFLQRSLHSGWSNSNDHDLLKHTAQLMSVIACSDVPKISMNVGNCFGSDYFALCGRSMDPTFYFCWPNARLAQSNEGHISESEDCSAFFAASRLWVDQLILPQHTRQVIVNCLKSLPVQSQRVKCDRQGQGVLRM